MANAFQRTLVRILAHLDQIDAGVEQVHSACIGSPLEKCADTMRESTWQMRGAVEKALRNSQPPPGSGG